jgi:hypothetical protein
MAKEGKATIKKTNESVVDAVILSAATESEHHEIAVYETLITNAEARGARGSGGETPTPERHRVWRLQRAPAVRLLTEGHASHATYRRAQDS